MAVRIVVEGVVQGVGYRAWMEGQARLLGVRGWVRNLDDGSVEAWLEGQSKAVEALIQASHEGPRFANVTSISRFDAADESLTGFEVRG